MATGQHNRANLDWKITDPVKTWEEVNAAILMDIREELRALNALLGCANFTGIPATLRQIRRNTTKPRKKAKAPA